MDLFHVLLPHPQLKMFERDWARACAKEKFAVMMSRENKASKATPAKSDKEMFAEVIQSPVLPFLS